MPDATGLELLAGELRDRLGDAAVLETTHFRGKAAIAVDPAEVRAALELVRGHGFRFMASLHGVDYFPQEPRLGIQYEMLDMAARDRLTVRTRVATDAPTLASVTDIFPTAGFQEREVFDMFGVVFDGHPDLRRIFMAEDYEGHPQRRDFPVGGDPVLFTGNEPQIPAWWQQ